LTKQGQSLKRTLQLIADILSFDSSYEQLQKDLNENPNWDAMVSTGSKHLMLPAIYCRLWQKDLLKYLPEELTMYLKEVTDLNRDRNTRLLEEAQQVSKLFDEHQIVHVYLKGIALIAGDYFEDIAERMIGDIDILIASDQLDKAFDLLVAQGYDDFIKFNYEVKNYRHYPRQIAAHRLGAIELHGQLLKHGFNHLMASEIVLANKQLGQQIPIPNTEHLIRNAIYANQINDRHSYLGSIHLKGIYDVLVLKLPDQPQLISTLPSQLHSNRFLNLSSIFFPSLSPRGCYDGSIYRRIFLVSMHFPKFGRLLYNLKKMLWDLQDRLGIFASNQSYRKHVLKKLPFK